jgi:hypothetical protein
MENLESFKNIPIDYTVLANSMSNYKYPKDKISAMCKREELIRLKKGLFIVSPTISHKSLSRELIANHIYGPSYISLESALSFYGLIPEKVYTVRSITIKRAKNFKTPLGSFEFLTANPDYFPIGLRYELVNNEFSFIIASPEKAISDMIIQTSNLRLQSLKAVRIYLEDDLRIDFETLKNFDGRIIERCIDKGNKKKELTYLLKLCKR